MKKRTILFLRTLILSTIVICIYCLGNSYIVEAHTHTETCYQCEGQAPAPSGSTYGINPNMVERFTNNIYCVQNGQALRSDIYNVLMKIHIQGNKATYYNADGSYKYATNPNTGELVNYTYSGYNNELAAILTPNEYIDDLYMAETFWQRDGYTTGWSAHGGSYYLDDDAPWDADELMSMYSQAQLALYRILLGSSGSSGWVYNSGATWFGLSTSMFARPSNLSGTNAEALKDAAYELCKTREFEVEIYVLKSSNGYQTLFLVIPHYSSGKGVKVEKMWSDGNDNHLNDSVKVTLYGNDKIVTVDSDGNDITSNNPVTLSAANDWTYTFENLPKTDSYGNEITYSFKEINVPPGYEPDINQNGNSFIIYNRIPTTNIYIQKKWNDTNHIDERPNSIKIELYGNNNQLLSVKTVYPGNTTWNDWTETFWDVPLYDSSGNSHKYKIKESTGVLDEYYKTTISPEQIVSTDVAQTGLDTFTVINTYSIGKKVTVVKVWDDDNNRDGKRPESIKITLLANGTALQKDYDGNPIEGGNPVTLTSAHADPNNPNIWTYTFKNLPIELNGEEIIYTIKEENVDGYYLVE